MCVYLREGWEKSNPVGVGDGEHLLPALLPRGFVPSTPPPPNALALHPLSTIGPLSGPSGACVVVCMPGFKA